MKCKGVLILVGNIFIVLGLLALLFIGTPPKLAYAKTYKLIFSQDYAEHSTYGKITKMVIKNIEDLTNGRVKVEAHYAGSLFKRNEAIEAVQNGTIQMTISSPSNDLQPYERSWNMFECPLLIRSNERLLRFWNSPAGKELQARTEAKGITCMVPYGTFEGTIFNARHSIKRIEDFKGLKLRVPTSPLCIEWIQALGGQAVSIPMAEAPSAISTGMVDGFLYVMWAAVPVWDAQHTSPYWLDVPFASPFGMIIANRDWLKSLPPDIKAGIIKGVNKTRQYHINIADADQEKYEKIYRETPGTVITEWDEAEMAKAQEIFKEVYKKSADKYDGWYMLNAFLNMK